MKPALTEVPANCTCGAKWMESVMIGVQVTRFSHDIKAITCPKCCASYKKISLGFIGPKEAYQNGETTKDKSDPSDGGATDQPLRPR